MSRACYARALELCDADRPSRRRTSRCIGAGGALRMDHRMGRASAPTSCSTLAQNLGEPALMLQAHHCQWATLYMLGAHSECCRHIEAGLALYEPIGIVRMRRSTAAMTRASVRSANALCRDGCSASRSAALELAHSALDVGGRDRSRRQPGARHGLRSRAAQVQARCRGRLSSRRASSRLSRPSRSCACIARRALFSGAGRARCSRTSRGPRRYARRHRLGTRVGHAARFHALL